MIKRVFPLLVLVLLLHACQDDYIPKPVGLFRIDIPEHNYVEIEKTTLPYTFKCADYAQVIRRFDKDSNWVNIFYPPYKATVFSHLPPDGHHLG